MFVFELLAGGRRDCRRDGGAECEQSEPKLSNEFHGFLLVVIRVRHPRRARNRAAVPMTWPLFLSRKTRKVIFEPSAVSQVSAHAEVETAMTDRTLGELTEKD